KVKPPPFQSDKFDSCDRDQRARKPTIKSMLIRGSTPDCSPCPERRERPPQPVRPFKQRCDEQSSDGLHRLCEEAVSHESDGFQCGFICGACLRPHVRSFSSKKTFIAASDEPLRTPHPQRR